MCVLTKNGPSALKCVHLERAVLVAVLVECLGGNNLHIDYLLVRYWLHLKGYRHRTVSVCCHFRFSLISVLPVAYLSRYSLTKLMWLYSWSKRITTHSTCYPSLVLLTYSMALFLPCDVQLKAEAHGSPPTASNQFSPLSHTRWEARLVKIIWSVKPKITHLTL